MIVRDRSNGSVRQMPAGTSGAQGNVARQLDLPCRLGHAAGGFIGDANLCVAQQHSTALISAFGSGYNRSVLAKARAPWATGGASDERAVKALVELLDRVIDRGVILSGDVTISGSSSAKLVSPA